jgi:universal stress protein E
MKILQNILVPVDFRESSFNAFHYAAKVSQAFHSNLIVLHVIHEESLSAKTEQLLRESIDQKYRELQESADPALAERMEFVVRKGVVFEQILKTAIDREINVVIAGSGSDSEKDPYQLSTIMEKLMRKSQIPLWVVRSSDQMPVKKILCPVDFSDASERALRNALTLASHLNAEITVMHVFTPRYVQSPRFEVDNDRENEILRTQQIKEFETFLDGFKPDSTSWNTLFEEGVPEKTILNTLLTGGYDLLIMGTTGKTGLSRILMGSVTEKVTRELPCSFITVKSQDIARTYFEGNLGEIETYLQKARQHREAGDLEKALEFYSAGLKQFPDNIPMLTGLIDTHSENGNAAKAAFFRDYARDVVTRIWGEEYIGKLGLD